MSAPPMIAAAYRFVWDSPITLRISSAMETARPVHSATTIFIRTSNSTPKEASALLMDSPCPVWSQPQQRGLRFLQRKPSIHGPAAILLAHYPPRFSLVLFL